ncbi:hypothetical protein ASZ90_005788 [hydrocarbon metagenome]|uniref:Uncharacterized protein n=1 Tax=hydrocarbon metagenome TaxID=938273 RepID=A0A0W8FU59_9ZZZZ
MRRAFAFGRKDKKILKRFIFFYCVVWFYLMLNIFRYY